MGACLRMPETKIYPRDCFACGEPMTPAAPGSYTLRCRHCEITENGTSTGIFPVSHPDPCQLGEDMKVEFVDHGGTMCFPSPDSVGYESVPVAKQKTPK
jgi:hypothetical protein